MAEGGCPPPAPTDPNVPNSGIRLLEPWHRCACAHPRAAVSDDSPLAAGLALRRLVARCPCRLSARQPMVRSAASLRRVPWGRFPDFSGSISELRLLAAHPAALRCLRLAVPRVCPVRSRGSGPPPGPGRICMAAVRVPRLRWRRRDLPGSWATHRLHAPLSDPGGTGSARPVPAPRCCLPHTSRRRLPRSRLFRGSITRPARLPVYASQPGSPPHHATLGSGWLANLGRSGLPPAGSHRRFPSCHCMASSFTKLCLAQDVDVRVPAMRITARLAHAASPTSPPRLEHGAQQARRRSLPARCRRCRPRRRCLVARPRFRPQPDDRRQRPVF